MRTVLWTGLGLLAFLISAATHLPASVAWRAVGDNAPIRAYAPTGTLWNGTAAAITQAGLRIESVSWRIRPIAMLTPSMAVTTQGRLPGEGTIELAGEPTFSGGWRIGRVNLNANVDAILSAVGQRALGAFAAGDVELLLRDLAGEGHRIEGGRGVATWRRAAVGPDGRLPLGEVNLRLTPAEGGGLSLEVGNREGAVELDGTLRLAGDGALDGSLTVTPRPSASGSALEFAHLLGLREGSPNVVTVSGNAFDGTARAILAR